QQNRLFLCDGDAMIISQKRLPDIFRQINTKLPWVKRIATYANAKSLKRKTLEELKEMKEMGLGIIYMGLESGDDETLAHVQKKGTAQDMIEQGRKVRQAGIKLSITVLLGLAGKERSHVHAIETGRVLSAIDPEYVGALCLMLTPNTSLYQEHQAGDFDLLGSKEMMEELGIMIANTNLSRGLFFANHASNYLPIKARLPRDKEDVMKLISDAVAGNVPLKPEMYRAL
ncbi:radical SAM protein, partial [bacterium]|nr:radical SAM protein [bacterium]